MDRAAVTTYLNGWYTEIIAETGLDIEPVLDAVQAVFDQQGDVLAPAWANLLADYFLLKRADLALDDEFDITTEDGDSYKLNQMHANVQVSLKAAYEKVAWLVDLLPPSEITDPNLGQVVTVIGHQMTNGWW